MEIKPVAAKLPDINIMLTHEEADSLQSMMYEARSYAADCGENTKRHDNFIDALELALGT